MFRTFWTAEQGNGRVERPMREEYLPIVDKMVDDRSRNMMPVMMLRVAAR